MKILHAVHGAPPEFLGGTEQYVAMLAAAQAGAGHAVSVLSGTSETAARAHVRAHGAPPSVSGAALHHLVRYGLCGDRWYHTDAPHAERPIAAWLGRARPDVLHIHHFVRLTRTLARTAAVAEIPVVWTFHDLSATCPCFNRVDETGRFHDAPLDLDTVVALLGTPDDRHVEEVRGEAAAYLDDLAAEVAATTIGVAPSEAQRTRVLRLLGLDATRVVTVPHGVLGTPPADAPATGPPREPLRLVHWGSFYRDKGLHVLVDAIARLERRAPGRVELTLWGKAVFPEYGERLEAAAATLPIRFAGSFTPADLRANDFDVAVFPTLAHESHSFVIDEAFQRGWPVIASALGALPDRVGAAGETVPPNDAGALAAAIERAAASSDRIQSWRRAVPRSLPTMAEHARTLTDVYARAIAAGPPPTAIPPPRVTADRLRHERAIVNREHELARLRVELERP